MTDDFIIRRKMIDVQQDLPTLFRKFISCEFASEKLAREYEELQKEFSKYFYENEGTENFQQGILARIAVMRHKTGISKIPFIVEFNMEFFNDTNSKKVLFVYHQDVGEVLNRLFCKEFEEMRITGSTIKDPLQYTADLNSIQRDNIRKEFEEDPDRRLLIASIMAAGEGLDGLQHVCQDLDVAERLWNPKKEEQAEARIQRIGSMGTKTETGELGRINANYIMVAGTIDEYFAELVEKKRANVDQTLDGKEYDFNEASLIKELATVLAQKGSKKWKL